MDIHYANFLANELYGVEVSEDKFEELALIAYNFIGNKNMRLYRYFAVVDPNTLSIELPCNAEDGEYIESVTCMMEEWEHVDNLKNYGDWSSATIEEYIERWKAFKDPLYQRGKYLKYERAGHHLYFDRPYGLVCVVYHGQVLNDDGLPEINDKEAVAIAAYIGYVSKYKEGLITMNKNILEAAGLLKRDWDIKCDLARTPIHISQNEMDEILDAKTNWSRKQFGKSYKPIL